MNNEDNNFKNMYIVSVFMSDGKLFIKLFLKEFRVRKYERRMKRKQIGEVTFRVIPIEHQEGEN